LIHGFRDSWTVARIFIKIKKNDVYGVFTLSFDVVGWDGCNFPHGFSIHNFGNHQGVSTQTPIGPLVIRRAFFVNYPKQFLPSTIIKNVIVMRYYNMLTLDFTPEHLSTVT
jgi:hypothetical protein